jgi:hypothetical protein
MAVRFFRIRILAVASMSSVGWEGGVRGRREGQKGRRVQKKKNQTDKKNSFVNVGLGLVERVKPKLKNKKLGQLESIY